MRAASESKLDAFNLRSPSLSSSDEASPPNVPVTPKIRIALGGCGPGVTASLIGVATDGNGVRRGSEIVRYGPGGPGTAPTRPSPQDVDSPLGLVRNAGGLEAHWQQLGDERGAVVMYVTTRCYDHLQGCRAEIKSAESYMAPKVFHVVDLWQYDRRPLSADRDGDIYIFFATFANFAGDGRWFLHTPYNVHVSPADVEGHVKAVALSALRASESPPAEGADGGDGKILDLSNEVKRGAMSKILKSISEFRKRRGTPMLPAGFKSESDTSPMRMPGGRSQSLVATQGPSLLAQRFAAYSNNGNCNQPRTHKSFDNLPMPSPLARHPLPPSGRSAVSRQTDQCEDGDAGSFTPSPTSRRPHRSEYVRQTKETDAG